MVWCIGKRNVDSQLRIETVSIKYQIKIKKARERAARRQCNQRNAENTK